MIERTVHGFVGVKWRPAFTGARRGGAVWSGRFGVLVCDSRTEFGEISSGCGDRATDCVGVSMEVGLGFGDVLCGLIDGVGAVFDALDGGFDLGDERFQIGQRSGFSTRRCELVGFWGGVLHVGPIIVLSSASDGGSWFGGSAGISAIAWRQSLHSRTDSVE